MIKYLVIALLSLLASTAKALEIQLIDPWRATTKAITQGHYPAASHMDALHLAHQQTNSLLVFITSEQAHETQLKLELSKACQAHYSLDPYHIKSWYQSDGAGKSIFKQSDKRVLVAELLLKNDKLIQVDHHKKTNAIYNTASQSYINIEEIVTTANGEVDGRNYQFNDNSTLSLFNPQNGHSIWIDIKLEKPIQANCQLEISALQNHKKTSTKITLSGLPYTLPKSKLDYPIYYRGRLNPKRQPIISTDVKSLEQLRQDYLMMRKHGFSNPSIYQGLNFIPHTDALFKLREEIGFNTKTVFHLGQDMRRLNKKFERFNYIKKAKNTAQKYGVKQWFVYGIDEANEQEWQAQLTTWQELQKQGLLIFAAGAKKQQLNTTKPDTFIAHAKPTQQQAKLWHSAGSKVYLYAYPQSGVEDHLLYRHNYGLTLWRSNYDGAMLYTFQGRAGPSIWNDFDHSGNRYNYRDHAIAYPASNKPIATLALKGFRQAVIDSQYLTLLNSCLAQNSKASNSTALIEQLKPDNLLTQIQTAIAKHCIPQAATALHKHND